MPLPNPTASESLPPQNYKIAFLKGIFLLAVVLAGALGVYRFSVADPLVAIDLLFAGAGLSLWLYLTRWPGQVEGVATIALAAAFVLFLAAFLLAPARVSEAIQRRFHAALVRALAEPELRARLTGPLGIDVVGSTPEEFGSFLKAQMALWGRVVRENNIRPGRDL